MRLLGIRVSDEFLRRVHVQAIKKGMSMQRYITSLIEQDLMAENSIEIKEIELTDSLVLNWLKRRLRE